MKRKIAAVLMADVAGPGQMPDAAVETARAVIRDAVSRGGGRMLAHPGAAPVSEFQSAVEAVRAAVDVQATLRGRNKALPAAEQFAFKIAIAIGEILDGDGNIPEETSASVTRLIALATPGGVCISRSVRDAVVSKLKLSVLDLTIEGVRPEPEPPTQVKRVAPPSKRRVFGLPAGVATVPVVSLGAAGLVGLGAALAFLIPGRAPEPPVDTPHAAVQIDTPKAKDKAAPSGGTLEFKPAYAPDPAAVLTARRMLPQAWKDCRTGSADTAVAACKLLLDSGIAKGEELADIHLSNGKAFRERHELDKALEAFSAAIAAAPAPVSYSLRGTVHYDKGNWDKAIADYSDAIRLDPANGEAFNNRAWTFYRAGRSAEALTDADRAVRLLAKEAYVWDTRAHIHAALGNRDAAIGDFRSALAIDPSNAASKAGLASLGAK